MGKHRVQKIEVYIGPKRLSSKIPDGKVLISAVIKNEEIFIDLQFDSRNVPPGTRMPDKIYEPLFREVEKTILKMSMACEMKVALVILPQDTAFGVWPLAGLERSLSREYRTDRKY